MKRKAKGEKIDKYLGMLYPIEEYKVYGYLTNTDIKFILVLNSHPHFLSLMFVAYPQLEGFTLS